MTESSLTLRELEASFSAMMPAALATCSANGVPNVAFLSIVRRVDEDRVALSFQFFNKTARNVRENPHAELMIVEPGSFNQFRLSLHYERTAQEGPAFDAMATQLSAVASQVGMADVFRLRGADIYRVLEIEQVPCDLDIGRPEVAREHLAGLDAALSRLDQATDLEMLFEEALDGLAHDLGYDHSLMMVFDEAREQLYAISSRGYASSGVGAEIGLSVGILGTAAARRMPVRVNNMERVREMGRAVRARVAQAGAAAEPLRAVPLPGLSDVMSQLAVPVLHRGNLLGLLCVESADAGAFSAGDESCLSTFARMLGAQMRWLDDASASPVGSKRSYGRASERVGPALRVEHYASDDSVFLDGEYLIKGLPGRILRKLVDAYLRDGRAEFTNKELRLDGSLGLSAYRDNLEARLILLRKRLEERSPHLRMEKVSRGCFRLAVACVPTLVGHD